MFVMTVGWITLQPFVPPIHKNHAWCSSHRFLLTSVALCCIVAGKDDAPFATIPNIPPKQITQKNGRRWLILTFGNFCWDCNFFVFVSVIEDKTSRHDVRQYIFSREVLNITDYSAQVTDYSTKVLSSSVTPILLSC